MTAVAQPFPTLLAEFNTQGYVISKGLFSPAEAQALIKEIQAAETIDGISALNKGTMTFYSGVYAKSQALQARISQPRVIDFLQQFIGPDFWVRWDQAVAKGPGSGTFPWHQDNAYNSLQDQHYQLWIALTHTTADNGGLWIVPGSHHQALPHKKMGNHRVYTGQPQNPVMIEAEPGDVILFSSFTLHSTAPNITQADRWAYVIEYMSLDDYDPGVKAPYFIVARDGQPTAEFVRFYRGQLNPLNHLKYWRWYLREAWRRS